MNKDEAGISRKLDEAAHIIHAAKTLNDKNYMIEQAIKKLEEAKR